MSEPSDWLTEARAGLVAEDERLRARLHAARMSGGLCAGCGRVLGPDEPVWWAPFALIGAYGRPSRRWGPVGKECAPPDLVREMEAEGPEACLGCGRGIYYGSTSHPRDRVFCSRRCRYRHGRSRAGKEPRP